MQAKGEGSRLLETVWMVVVITGTGGAGRAQGKGRVQVAANGLDSCAGRAQGS